jgi:hypothetical protein
MDHVRLLFITLLALSDRDGIVYGSRSGLMRAAMIDLDAAEEHDPWRILMGPDDDSSDLMRNPENEGRRIEEIPGGFKIINYTYYRSLRDAEDRKAQNREAQQRHREKISPDKPPSAKVSRGKPIESKIETKKKEEGANGSRLQSVEDWLKELEADKTYQGIDVRREYGKMLAWCNVRRKQPTKRRFINWINGAEKPLPSKHSARVDYKRRYSDPPVEQSDEERESVARNAREEAARFKEQFK